MRDKIRDEVKAYILKEFLPGEDPDELTESTPLITGGILDSLATLKLVAFLEDEYRCTFEPYEVDAEHLNTISTIADLVVAKR